MGCCFGREMNGSEYSDEVDQTISIGAKKPLYQEKIRWESDIPLTDGQLRSKRDEFWETAPAFEGRKEIWDALKGAATNAEQGDFALAQAIIDGANISLPNGILTDAYDELGNRYQIPIYCLYMPVNMIEDGSENSTTARPSTPDAAAGDMEASTSNRADIIDCEKRKKKLPGSTDFYSNDSEANNTNRQSKSSSPFLKFKPGKRNRDVQTSAVSSRDIKSVPSNTSHFDPVSLFFRLSHDSRDVAMQVRLNETVGTCKKRLCTQLECESPADQRWFFGGRQLPDRMRLCDCPGLNQENLVVQVIVPPTTTFDVEGQNSHLLDQNDVKARKEALKIAEQSASIEMTNTTSSSCHLSAKLKKGLPILQPSTPELNYDALPGVCITDTIATVTLVSSAEVVEHESDDTENETDTLLKKTGTISTLGIVEE